MLNSTRAKTAVLALACSLSWSVNAADAAKRIAVPAGDLLAAIELLQQQSDVQVVYNDAELKGIKTAGVSGTFTAQEAVKKLLQGTTLRVSTDAVTGAMLIVPAQEPTATTSTQAPEEPLMRLVQTNESVAEAHNNKPNDSRIENSSSDAALEEIVVTAQKRNERLQDVPISMSVLTGAELDQSTGDGLREVLARVPGVAVSTGGTTGGDTTSVTIRGVAAGMLGVASSPVGYYLDSVPFGSVKNQFMPDIDVYDLERVEVLRGPQGTLYGASSQNGVVRVLTKNADLNAFEFKTRTSFSSTKEGGENYSGDLAVNVPIVAGKVAARAVLGFQNFGGWIDKANQKDANDSTARNLRLKLNAAPTEQFSVALSAWVSSADSGAPAFSADGLTRTYSLAEPRSTDFETYSLKMDYAFPTVAVTSMTSYLDYATDTDWDFSSVAFPNVILRTYSPARTFTQEFNLASTQEGWCRSARSTRS